jgi:hypothetical protein
VKLKVRFCPKDVDQGTESEKRKSKRKPSEETCNSEDESLSKAAERMRKHRKRIKKNEELYERHVDLIFL